ncbi:predicted protein [Botrytis cinerea T4]|uniref:Uncharacterized protein n=1 Tax=Botryotinia fuckeliana (strain T4) TaxID=999810 RepID=G2Y2J0_BOTF4|nr:predicted protein [Botrytis cinerea T4]
MHKYFNDTFISSLNYTAVSIAALWSRGFGLGKDVKFLMEIFKLQAKRTKSLGHIIIVPAQFNVRLAIVDVVQGRNFHDHCPALQLSGFNASKPVCAVCVVPLFWYSRHN